MEENQKLVFNITKAINQNGNLRFRIKAHLPNYSKISNIELWEQASVITDKKRVAEKEKLKKEFLDFVRKKLLTLNLLEDSKKRVDFQIRFGDEYSIKCCFGGIPCSIPNKEGVGYEMTADAFFMPLTPEEITFFWECIKDPILI